MSSTVQGLPRFGDVWRRFGSLRVTLIGLLLLIGATSAIYQQEVPDSRWLVPPLALLAGNLLCAIVSTTKFRVQTFLLAFHLALLAIVVLAALGRLSSLSGSVELADGVPFAGRLDREVRGPLHRGGLASVHFVSEGFSIDYGPGPRREETRNVVRWLDGEGQERRSTIGDDEPLIIEGYRFYTTFNKGFAPLFRWTPAGGESALAAVHLPAYPAEGFDQARAWIPPGSEQSIWFLLDIEEQVLDPGRDSVLRIPDRYRLTVREGDRRHELRAGGRIRLSGGELEFVELRGWMGYRVFYDWTMHWLLVAGMVAVVSLAAHFGRRFAARPWDA